VRYEQLLTEAMTPAERSTVASTGTLPAATRAAVMERAYVKAFGPPPKPVKGAKPRKGAPPDSAAAAAEAIRISNMDVRLRQSVHVPPDEIHAVARARVLAIKERLLAAGIVEDRIFIVTSMSPAWQPPPGEVAEEGGAPADSASAPLPVRDVRRVRVRLSLTGE